MRNRLTLPPISQTQRACVSSCPKTYNNIGLGRPKNVTPHKSVPREKNQNSSEAQKRWCMAAVERQLKNARVNIQAGGTRKTATICFSERTGTTHSVSTRFEGAPARVLVFWVCRFRVATFSSGTTHICPRTRVDSDHLALFDEQWD